MVHAKCTISNETWYMFDTLPEYGFEVIWAHITNKQKKL